MNPYNLLPPVVLQLFVSEPFNNTIAVINLVPFETSPNQIFGLGSVSRISSPLLRMPVDLAAVQRDTDNINWASNTAGSMSPAMRQIRMTGLSSTCRFGLPLSSAPSLALVCPA
jgi:hypothetical protein